MTPPVLHPRLTRAVRWLPPVAAVLVAAGGVLVLVGWRLDVALLKGMLHRDSTPMNPATAVCFILAAAAVWGLRKRSAAAEVTFLARVLAAVVVSAAILRLGGYAIGGHARVDEFLFRSRLGGNRMAPNTAAGFLLLGLALLLLDVRTRGRQQAHLAQFLVLGVACIALMSLIGYLFSTATLYGVGEFIPMALNTAICFALLATGLLAARPDRQPVVTLLDDTGGGAIARRLLPAAFVLPLLLGYLRLFGERHQWFSANFGLTLLVVGLIVLLNALIWWNAQVQRHADLRRRIAEDALRQSEQRHRAVMEQAAEGIYLLDLDTAVILDCNAALERLLGYARGELAGKTAYDIIEDSRQGIDARVRRLIDGGGAPLHGERLYRRKDGSVVEVESSAAVITYAGRSVASTVVHDITARKRLERELQAAVRAERDALEKLKSAQSTLVQTEKLASLGQMVAGVAHEINNPLAFVSNNVAVLQRDVRALTELLSLYTSADPLLVERRPELAVRIRELSERLDLGYTLPSLDELLARSREGLRRIQQIVKDLREFARLDAADLHEANLNAGIESTVNIVRGLAKKRQVTVELHLDAIPLVACYPAKINQVVMNLVTNALDACGPGGRVTVSTARDADGVRIDVVDTGGGIPAEVRQRIFDPFFTTKPVGKGTGLGLSISYGIVRDHGGTIEVESEPGKGARFTVHLPTEPTRPREGERARPESAPSTPTGTART